MEVKNNKITLIKIYHFPIYLMTEISVLNVLFPIRVPMNSAGIKRSYKKKCEFISKCSLLIRCFPHLYATPKKNSYAFSDISIIERATVNEF